MPTENANHSIFAKPPLSITPTLKLVLEKNKPPGGLNRGFMVSMLTEKGESWTPLSGGYTEMYFPQGEG